MTQTNKAISKRILFLDYLRIFAFVSVLIGHKFINYLTDFIKEPLAHATPRYIANLSLPLVKNGGAGVVVFFLISGYIITFVLQRELPKVFFIKRIFRIYPLYIIAVLMQVLTVWMINGSVPKLSVLIPQLLLIGDFFDAPYTLKGVEWTLRIEVLFYVFMGIASYLGLFKNKKRFFPYLILLTVSILGVLMSFPGKVGSFDRTMLYAPFLLLGSLFYLNEKKEISAWFLFLGSIIVLSQYYYLTPIYQPHFINSHFATLSVLLFFFAWRYREIFESYPLVLFLSNLTYSVYLFHNWSWEPIKKVFSKLSIEILNSDIQALFTVLLISTLTYYWIEKPGIRLGRTLLSRRKTTHKKSTAS